MMRNKAYLIAQSLICALTAGLLAHAVISLYVAGAAEQAGGELFAYIFTREKVAAKLAPILPLIWIGIGMTLAGWLAGLADDEKPTQDAEILRNLTCARVSTPTDAMTAERTRQKRLFWLGWIGFAASMVPIALYLLNGTHFDRPGDTEADLFALLKTVVPFTLLGFVCLITATLFREKSFKREADAAKTAEKSEPAPIPVKAVPQDAGRGVVILRIVVAALAVALIVAGIFNGGLDDVLMKANAICMECVGLG